VHVAIGRKANDGFVVPSGRAQLVHGNNHVEEEGIQLQLVFLVGWEDRQLGDFQQEEGCQLEG